MTGDLVDIITSKDNSKVKYLASLHDSKTSRREGVVFIEGKRSCEDALQGGVVPSMAIADEDLADGSSSGNGTGRKAPGVNRRDLIKR